jgi:hypothetical protein
MKKQKKLTKKQQALQSDWDSIVNKWASVPKFARTKVSPKVATSATTVEEHHIPSKVTPGGSTAKKESTRYTGTLIVGIATMHKSNAVPILNQQEAIEVSSMRRG